MGLIVLWIFIGLVFLGGLIGAFVARESSSKGIAVLIALVAAVAEVCAIVFGCLTTIGPSDIGVITSFGKPAGDLTPGVHWLSPTANVTVWDNAVQDVTYTRQQPLQVHIGGQQTAYLAVTLQYQIKPGAIDQLFQKYRKQPNMQQLLVTRSLDQAINDQLQNFSPIDAVAAGTSNGDSLVPFQSLVKNQMISDIGQWIDVESVFMPYVSYDPETTARLNSLQTQKADTLIAAEAVRTAEQRAAALRDLQNQANLSTNAIAELCFQNVLEPIVKAGGNPAGIQCWPGGSAANVVITPKN